MVDPHSPRRIGRTLPRLRRSESSCRHESESPTHPVVAKEALAAAEHDGIIRERMPPGTAEVNHFHVKARQFFYVLSGVAVMSMNDAEVELRTGEGLEIDPGVPHQVHNRGEADVEFLVVSQPHSHGDRHV